MKKTISFLLAMILMCSCFALHSPAANALGAVWVKEFYKDKFGDKTERYYITNKSQFKGTYNSDSVSNGKLGASLVFERDGERLLAYVMLFHDGKDQLRNSTSFVQSYDIDIKKADGSRLSTYGEMTSGEDRIEVFNTIALSDALLSGGEISIYIEKHDNAYNNYLFKAKSGNFRDIYIKEIFSPYQEEQYQRAIQFSKNNNYEQAAEIFEVISGYKDSAILLESVVEAKNADAYSQAEALLAQKEFDKAADAFAALGDYLDSSIRVTEVLEAKNAHAYSQAEKLLEQEHFDEAAKVFEELGDYSDSADRVAQVHEAERSASYTSARKLYDEGHYLKAYYAFQEITGYNDVDDLLKNDRNLRQAVEKEELLHSIGSKVSFGMFEQDNNISNGAEPIEWIVLACEDNSSLLISCDVLAVLSYNEKDVAIKWDRCSLRNWLNDDFFNTAFDDAEKEAIMLSENENAPFIHEHYVGEGSWGGKEYVSGGNDTSDYVFLLSYDEAKRYFNSDVDRISKPSIYANENRNKEFPYSLCCQWWLRSPSGHEDSARFIFEDGRICPGGSTVSDHHGVRPALWIDLNNLDF